MLVHPLSLRAKTISLAKVARLTAEQAETAFAAIRWPETDGKPVCPHCGCLDAYAARRHLCDAFELSRSGLYRACRPDGGVAALIRQRRTEIARVLLGEAVEPPRSDAAVARLSGFTRLRALKRALHDLHATTPLRLRRAALDPELAASRHRIEVSALLER